MMMIIPDDGWSSIKWLLQKVLVVNQNNFLDIASSAMMLEADTNF